VQSLGDVSSVENIFYGTYGFYREFVWVSSLIFKTLVVDVLSHTALDPNFAFLDRLCLYWENPE
jgi:hypothetical protein